MNIGIELKSLPARIATVVIAVIVLGLLVQVAITEFITGTLIDTRFDTTPEQLIAAAEYVPDSGRLYARIAEVERQNRPPDLASAAGHAMRAIELSPNNYKYRLLLASIQESRGDMAGAENSIQDALSLAPNYAAVHWRMANLQLRMGRLKPAIEHLHAVGLGDPDLVPAALDLLWIYSKQDVASVRALAEGNPPAQMSLAVFLSDRGRGREAIDIFSAVANDVRGKSPNFSPFLDSLIKNGYPGGANAAFTQTIAAEGPSNLFWNGDFEQETVSGLPIQFGWHLRDSAYARARIENRIAHSGGRSLEIVFAGKDTTRLTDEVRHLFVLEPSTDYRVEFYVKTKALQTPEGPRVVIIDKVGKAIGQSDAVPAGDMDWTMLAFNFTTPVKSADDAAALTLSVRREPRFAYDNPTKGQIWFDDFTVSRLGKK